MCFNPTHCRLPLTSHLTSLALWRPADIKFVTADKKFTPKGLKDDTPYTVMFGADKCGDTNKASWLAWGQGSCWAGRLLGLQAARRTSGCVAPTAAATPTSVLPVFCQFGVPRVYVAVRFLLQSGQCACLLAVGAHAASCVLLSQALPLTSPAPCIPAAGAPDPAPQVSQDRQG